MPQESATHLHFLGQELREAGQHVLAPLREVHNEGLKGLEGQPSELFVHVDRQPAEQVYQLTGAHAFGDQPGIHTSHSSAPTLCCGYQELYRVIFCESTEGGTLKP